MGTEPRDEVDLPISPVPEKPDVDDKAKSDKTPDQRDPPPALRSFPDYPSE